MAGVGFAIAGTVLSAAGVAQSFVQAGKQNKLRREAEAEAAKSMEQARKILKVNYLEGISAPMRAYEESREGIRQAGAQALQAGIEGEQRGVASTAGRVLMGAQKGERAISAKQEEDMLRLQELAATEDARLSTGLANLELMDLRGAQQAARDAQMAQQQAVKQGFEGLKKLGATVVDYQNELIPLFQRQGPDFSSVGGNMISQQAISASPTRYGQYQGQDVYLPDVFQGGMEFTSGLTANPNPLDYTPKLLQPISRG